MNPFDQLYQSASTQQQQNSNPFDALYTPQDVSNAQAKVGNQDDNGYCETFVEQMAGKPNMGGSAAEAWNNYVQQGQAREGTKGMTPGSLIYFAPDDSNGGFGHTGIYLGNNKFISATYDGVKANDLNDWQQQTGQRILGYVPQ